MKRGLRWTTVLFLVAAVTGAGLGTSFADTPAGDFHWNFESHAPQQVSEPAMGTSMIELSLDDGTADGSFGISVVPGTAQQFLWLNQFDLAAFDPLRLTEVHVLFPADPNIAVDDPVQIAIYHDTDGDPTNGADLLIASDELVQAVDGTTFSVYPLAAPLDVPTSGELLIGVVGRFVTSGVTPPTEPAAIDTTASQARSWLAVWTTDVPAQPDLTPDLFFDRIDVFLPGNWMIRGIGEPVESVEIPTLGTFTLALLALLLGVAGVRRLR